MLLIIGIAAAAAASVLIYNAYRDSHPDMASNSTRRAQQLAAVVLVLSRAVEGVIEALTLGLRPEPALGSSRTRGIDSWDREDW